MYKNNVESLKESGYCKKNLQGKLANIIAEHHYFERLQCYQYLTMISNIDQISI